MNLSIQDIVLAGLLAGGKDAWEEHRTTLHAGLFFGDRRNVYTAILNLHAAGRLVDAVTVLEKLGETWESNDLLMHIGRNFVSQATLGSYIQELQVQFTDNRARDVGAMLLENGDYEAAQKALETLGDTSAIIGTVDSRTALKALWDDVQGKLDQDTIGLATGLTDLDARLGGLSPGDLILLAARPSMGKTALMLNIAQNVNCPVGIFSLEMPTSKLMARMLAARGIDHGRLKHPRTLTDEDWAQMVKASQQVKSGLHINDIGGLSLTALEVEARRMVKTHGVGLICIDYLQLVTCKAEKRLEVVSEVSRRLKALAKNLKVPVIALSQLNRESENKINPVLSLAQLRESGQLEQDADIVIFIDRPEQRDKSDRPGEADLIIAKHRDGETGTVRVAWQGRYQRFMDLQRNWYQGAAA